MLTPLDTSLYSNKIQLAKTPAGWIFLIFKNGSSTIASYCRERNYKIYYASEITDIDEVVVFIRNPIDRFKSGLQTVVHNLMRDNDHKLDSDTVAFMVQKYLFLDVHFLPQFHWLLNLSSYIGNNVKLKLQSIDDIDHLLLDNTRRIPEKSLTITINESNYTNLHLQLDEILFNQIGNTLTFAEIVNLVKSDPDAKFDEIISTPLNIAKVIF